MGMRSAMLKVTASFQFIELRYETENEFVITASCYCCGKKKKEKGPIIRSRLMASPYTDLLR